MSNRVRRCVEVTRIYIFFDPPPPPLAKTWPCSYLDNVGVTAKYILYVLRALVFTSHLYSHTHNYIECLDIF